MQPDAQDIEWTAVEYSVSNGIARIKLNRPQYRNAQNSEMTYQIERAMYLAGQDDDVRVIVLSGNGPSFSSGHDIASPGRDVDKYYPPIGTWPTHIGKPGAEGRLAREEEVYMEMCRRWRDLSKPTIAMVHGYCIGGGLMLAWVCDLIVASEDALFCDPVVRFGVPGVEYFSHPWEFGVRKAKQYLFTGAFVTAQEAHRLGMVNEVYTKDDLEEKTLELAAKIAEMPPFAVQLAKKAVNESWDAMGYRVAMNTTFALHHVAHSHNAETTGDSMINYKSEGKLKDSRK